MFVATIVAARRSASAHLVAVASLYRCRRATPHYEIL